MTSDFARRDQIDLAGTWQLAFDAEGEGVAAGWMNGHWPETRADRVQAPAAWNLTHPDAAGTGYYRTTVVLPTDWAGRVIHLHIGGASYRAEAWLNGRYLGSHEGAYTAFRFDATGAVRLGEANELVIRVTSLSRTRLVDGMALNDMPVSKQSWYYAEGGLWGAVRFEVVPLLRCEAISVEPNLRQESARVEVTLANAGSDGRVGELALAVTGPTGDVVAKWRETVAVPPGGANYLVEIKIPRPLPWSCADPNLYQVQATISERGEDLDTLRTSFGMRDFTVENGRFLLNGEPIYIRGILLQPNFPAGLIAPLDPTLMEREVLLAKEAGFNLIRIHIRPSIAGYYDLTDRHGMLVYAESSLAWLKDTPRLLDHGRRELTEMIERDRNHPSVVFWGIFNEHRFPAARYADALVRTARALDPTRVIVDNSGGTLAMDQDYGWIDRATAVPNRESARVPFQDIHLYIGAPVPRAACEWLRSIGDPKPAVDIAELGYGSPPIFDEWYRELRTDPSQILVSELGCGGMADLDEMVAGFEGKNDLLDSREFVAYRDSLREGFAARGLDRIFESTSALADAAQIQQAIGNRRQIESVMVNPRTSGYILTQLNDVGSEFHAGIVNLWRRPKPTYTDLTRLNRDRCLVLFGKRAVATSGDTVVVSLTVIDRIVTRGGGGIKITVSDPDGKTIAEEERTVPPGQGIKELGGIGVQTGAAVGEYRVTARDVGDDQGLLTTTETILVLPPVDPLAVLSDVTWLGEQSAGTESASLQVNVAASPNSLTTSNWETLFSAVEAGATGIIGPLRPGDTAALDALALHGIPVEAHFALGNWMGQYHWQPASKLFAGLPAGGLAGEAYADVLPRYCLTELGGTLLAGSFRNTETRRDVAKMLWFSEVEVMSRGHGRLIFCQYRVFDKASANPLADRLRLNLLQIAANNETTN